MQCGCGKTLGKQNRSGKCVSCFNAWLNADPEVLARRRAAQIEFFARPEVKAKLRDRLVGIVANMGEAERERRREHGRRQHRDHLSRPDVVARTLSPETRARAGKSRSETVLAWCPPELRASYYQLVRSQKLSAAEARALLEPEIPGTAAHARRQVENRLIAGRIRDENQKAQAY